MIYVSGCGAGLYPVKQYSISYEVSYIYDLRQNTQKTMQDPYESITYQGPRMEFFKGGGGLF